MNLEEQVKEEIYKYVSKFKLNKDEIEVIDTYVLEMLSNFKFIFSSHEDVINQKDNIDKLKKIILENIGE